MATLGKQYTFSPGVAVSAQVNQNFDDLIAFVNQNCIQKDGSLAFTAIPVLPDVDPSTSNQATRKSYVDAAVGGVATTAASAASAAASAGSAATAAAAAAANAAKFTNMNGTSPIGGGAFSGTALLKAGFNVVTLDGNGDANINFGNAFPNGIISVTATLVLGAGTVNVLQANSAVWGAVVNAFKTRVYRESTGASITSGTVGVSWVAVGW